MNITKVFPLTWYAIAWSNDIRKKPIKKKILGKEMVLYRTEEGQINAIHPYCTHRGADLSLGSVSGSCIVCPYHGWEFNKDGKCTHIPSQPNGRIPKFAHSKVYPVQERGGLVWIYPEIVEGNVISSDLIIPTELEDEQFRTAPYHKKWDAHFTRVIESVLDVAHLAFVHKKTIGRKMAKEIKTLNYEVYKDDIRIISGNADITYTYPQHWMQRIGEDVKMFNYVTFTPIDEEETLIFGINGRSFAKSLFFMDNIFSWYSSKILKEDQMVVESQHPRPIPEALRLEAHVRADAPQVKFRMRWFQLLEDDNEKKIIID